MNIDTRCSKWVQNHFWTRRPNEPFWTLNEPFWTLYVPFFEHFRYHFWTLYVPFWTLSMLSVFKTLSEHFFVTLFEHLNKFSDCFERIQVFDYSFLLLSYVEKAQYDAIIIWWIVNLNCPFSKKEVLYTWYRKVDTLFEKRQLKKLNTLCVRYSENSRTPFLQCVERIIVCISLLPPPAQPPRCWNAWLFQNSRLTKC